MAPELSRNAVPPSEAAPQPGLVLAPGPEGWWDSERVSGPSVMRGADGVWKMWYYGRDASFDRQINLPNGRCGFATSADGVYWERVRGPLTMGAVFEPSPDPGRFDSAHVGVSDVSAFDGLVWMWYFGGDQTVVSINQFTAKGIQMRSRLCRLPRRYQLGAIGRSLPRRHARHWTGRRVRRPLLRLAQGGARRVRLEVLLSLLVRRDLSHRTGDIKRMGCGGRRSDRCWVPVSRAALTNAALEPATCSGSTVST